MGPKRSLSSKKSMIDLPPNDDETERMLNRSNSVVAPQSNSSNTLAQYNEIELDNHYNYCIKLANENKITSKNAFSLKMIEFLSMRYIENKGVVVDNFQAAGKELETSAKIYACRVDALHSDTMALASTIRMGTKNNEEKENDGESNDDEVETKRMPVKKKIKKFICTDLEKINRKPEKNYKVNTNLPKIDKNGCHFLYTCIMLNDSGEILLDPETPFWNSTNDDSHLINSEQKISLADIPSLNKDISHLKFTSKLEGFRFNAGSSANQNLNNTSHNISKADDDMIFDMDAEVLPINDDPEPPEGETFLSDAEEERSALRESAIKSAQPSYINEMTIDQLRPHLKSSDYSYFTGNLLIRKISRGNWLPKIVAERLATVKKSVKSTRKRNFIADTEIDFDKLPDEVDLVTKSSLRININANLNNTLNKDNRYSVNIFLENLNKYFNHKNISIKHQDHEPLFLNENIEEIAGYNYDNPADMTDYCPSLLEDDGNHQGDEEIYENGINFTGFPNNLDDKLTNDENQTKFQIKIPKPVDMKKLKEAILDKLTEGKMIEVAYEDLKTVMRKTTFTNIWTYLPTRLSQDFISNLSAGLVNFAILQICNEFGLKLLNIENNINDFTINII